MPLDARALSIPRGWWIAAIAIFALRIALLMLSTPLHRALTGDEPLYDDVARSVLAGRGFMHAGATWVGRPPGWPLLLAGIYLFVGTSPHYAVIFQGLFDAGTALLFAWLAFRIYRSRLATCFVFLTVALWPPFLRESRFLQTDPSFTFALAAMVALFFRFSLVPSWTRAIVVGLVIGVATLIRPAGPAPAAGLILGFLLTHRHRLRQDAPRLLVILAVGALVLEPWTIRNALRFHAFVPLSVGGGQQLLLGSLPDTDGRWDAARWPQIATPILAYESARLGRTPDPIEADRAFLRIGLMTWRRHPMQSLTLYVKRLWRLCLLPVSEGDRPVLRIVFLLVLLVLYALAVPQAISGWRSRDPAVSYTGVLALSFALYAVTTSIVYTNSRYIEPLRPFILLLAAGMVARRPAKRTSILPG